MNELKPCPFCGGKEIRIHQFGYGLIAMVECPDCKTRVVFPWSRVETANDLFKAWNRRAGEQDG